MVRMDWRESRRAVELELAGIEGVRLLDELRNVSEIARSLPGWQEVFEALRRIGADQAGYDAILLWLFGKAKSADARAAEVALLGVFHPMLESIHKKKASWETDPEVRWGEVLWAFFRAIRRFRPETRSERIAGKIYGDTVHDLYQECRRRWTSVEREQAHDPSVLSEMADTVVTEHPCGEAGDPSAEDNSLERFRRSGVIDDVELALLTFVYGEGLSVKTAAEKAGLGYEAAKKRKQRAETAIAEVVKNNF